MARKPHCERLPYNLHGSATFDTKCLCLFGADGGAWLWVSNAGTFADAIFDMWCTLQP